MLLLLVFMQVMLLQQVEQGGMVMFNDEKHKLRASI
jgi:hypothetical protein